MESALFLPLLSRFPALASRFPRVSLGEFPTPVHRLERLGAALGLRDLWIKRDDLSGATYGGNKVRKLEFLLGPVVEAQKAGRAVRLCGYGPFGSHWAFALTHFAAQRKIPVDLVLFKQPLPAEAQHDFEATKAAARHVRCVPSPLLVGAAMAAELARPGAERSFLMPPGGSSVASTLGYVNAAMELAEQVRAGAMPEPAAVVTPMGTGGTMAGLWLGLRLGGLSRTRVVGVRVTDRIVSNRLWIEAMAARTWSAIRRVAPTLPALSGRTLEVVQGFIGPGYGIATAAGREATRAMADLEGIPLDPVYTAKTVAALRPWAEREGLAGATILYWHTFNSR